MKLAVYSLLSAVHVSPPEEARTGRSTPTVVKSPSVGVILTPTMGASQS